MQADTATIEELLRQEEVVTVIPSLPDYLVERFRDYQKLQEELDILQATLNKRGGILGFGQKMPGDQIRQYRARIRNIQGELAGLVKVAEAIRLGYQPYTPPSNWYLGCLGNSDRASSIGISSMFSAPIPATVLDKHWQAKATGVFNIFMVSAPDKSLFTEVRSLFCDPVLIGYVSLNGGPIIFHHYWDCEETMANITIENGTGFLIAMWDLEKDRKAAGLDF